MPPIGVVHLVRRANGTAPLARFLASCDRHPAGAGHDLVLVFKGFPGDRVVQEYEALLAGRPHQRLFVRDAGYDISAYLAAARELPHSYLCFLNSFSVALAPDWLAILYSQAIRREVGIAGATGSYLSLRSALDHPPYLNPNHPRYKQFLLKWFPVLRTARNFALRPVYNRLYDPFPNYHVRTNSFLMRREIMLAIPAPRIRPKFQAHSFESGRKGLTRQVIAMGKLPIIVGKDGRGYPPEEWHLSDTFWQSNQQNLLVADNRTEHYRKGSLETRRYYAVHAWGRFARPESPQESA